MIRLIIKSSCQVSEDEWSVFYETVDIENEDLESKMKNGGRHVVGAEIVKTPTSDNNDYAKCLECDERKANDESISYCPNCGRHFT
jgi:Zn finger protein HypA/HybF involved in hydrogenase expression